MQDESSLGGITTGRPFRATAQKLSVMLVTPVPLVVLGSYGMNHVRHTETSGAWHQQELATFLAVPNALGFMKNPDGMLFFASGIAAAFLLTFLWLRRRHTERNRVSMCAIILAPPLIALATGLDILVALLCILPWSMYTSIVLSDAAHTWLDWRYTRADTRTLEVLEDAKTSEMEYPIAKPVLMDI